MIPRGRWIENLKDIPDKSVDFVCVSYVLHHISNRDLPSVASELKRILSRNGVILIKEHKVSKSFEADIRPGDFSIEETEVPAEQFVCDIHNLWASVQQERPGLRGSLYFRTIREITLFFRLKTRITDGNNLLHTVYLEMTHPPQKREEPPKVKLRPPIKNPKLGPSFERRFRANSRW